MGKFAAVAAAVAIATALAVAAPANAAYKARISKGTLTLTGNGKSEKLQLRLRAGNKNTLQVDVGLNGTADFSFDRRRFKRIVVNAGGGVDTITIAENYGAFTTTEKTTLNGGPGDDRITGGKGGETFSGGPGDDWLIGKEGRDTFGWTSPDGSDRVDGGGGFDVLRVTGSSAADVVDVSPVLGRVRVARSLDSLDVGTTEVVSVDGAGGDDHLTGTSGLAALVTLDLAGGAGTDVVTGGDGADVLSGGTGNDSLHGGPGADFMLWQAGDGNDTVDGDGDSDTFAADGSAGSDAFALAPAGPRLALTGPSAALSDVGSTEKLELRTLGGNDTVSGVNGVAALGVAITIDGGAGNDTLGGSDADETIRGGDGNDTVDPNRGSDKSFLGAGNDTVQWDPGDGSDTVEGEAGSDRLVFNGANVAENIDLSADGARLRFFRDVANITMTLGAVERVDYNALGGSDTLVVNDLSATAAKSVYANLAASGGAGDGAVDDVQVFGTTGANTVAVSPSSGTVSVTGLSAAVHVTTAEPANDDVLVFGLAGADKLSASSGLAALIGLTLNGGSGNDTITGGDGNDVLQGDTENDTIFGGAGADSIVGGLGADTLNGQAGPDNYTCLTAGDTVTQDGTDTIGPVCP